MKNKKYYCFDKERKDYPSLDDYVWNMYIKNTSLGTQVIESIPAMHKKLEYGSYFPKRPLTFMTNTYPFEVGGKSLIICYDNISYVEMDRKCEVKKDDKA